MKKTIATLVGLGLSFSFVPAAQAARVDINHGKDTGYGNSNTDAVGVADNECDGNSVYLHYRLVRNGEVVSGRVHDYNGCEYGGVRVVLLKAT